MFIAERGDTIEGFAVYQLHHDRIEILNLAVHPSARRSGVASVLMAKLIYKTESQNRPRLSATCREDNLPFLALLKKHGARAVGFARNYYADGAGGVHLEHLTPVESWCDTPYQPINRLEKYVI